MHRRNGTSEQLAGAVRRHPSARGRRSTTPEAPRAADVAGTIALSAAALLDDDCETAPETHLAHRSGGPRHGAAVDQLELFDTDDCSARPDGHFDADFELHPDIESGIGAEARREHASELPFEPDWAAHDTGTREISLLNDGIVEGPRPARSAGDRVLFRRAGARYVPSK